MSSPVRCPNADCPAGSNRSLFDGASQTHCPRCQAKLVPVEAGAFAEPTSGTLLGPTSEWIQSRDGVSESTGWDLKLGSTFAGRYEVLKVIGKGGMGVVYLVRDVDLDRNVALKIPTLGDADETFVRRFQREARVGAQLSHDNRFCRIIDVNKFEDLPYLTMDFIEGRPLTDVLAEQGGRMPVPCAVRLARMLAEALSETHARGIIHRDLKPANIMIRDDGSPVLMDFGLARREADTQLTASGAMGTPAYMSPEQAKGDSQAVGLPTDIYSLGVILYELLTGHKTFDGSNRRGLLYRIVYEDPAPPSTYCPNLDPRLEAICLKALKKAPEDRFATMGELAEALKPLCDPGPGPRPEPGPNEPVSRRGRWVAVASVVLLGLAALAVIRFPAFKRGPGAASPAGPRAALVDRSSPAVPAADSKSVRPPIPPAVPLPGLMSASIGMTFVLIPPGRFEMGSPREEGQSEEHPQHPVAIGHRFVMGKHEVTQVEYKKVTGESPSQFSGDDHLPVEQVSWLDAVRFCNALSDGDRFPSFYKIEGESVTVPDWSAPGYRLPTEAEWEYVCRGRTSGKFGPASEEGALVDRAWYRDHSRPDNTYQTHPVGTKQPNAFGLHDLQGNVWEWCWDWYADGYASEDPVTDPTGPASGTRRVLRGGAYNSPASILRCAVRNQGDPGARSPGNGFRVCRTVAPP
jgi:formylglycine-generating enzyme required for sulfatase activity/predicted Ser/Thr protein kinase